MLLRAVGRHGNDDKLRADPAAPPLFWGRIGDFEAVSRSRPRNRMRPLGNRPGGLGIRPITAKSKNVITRSFWRPEDPRILVPKIVGWGWTINFASYGLVYVLAVFFWLRFDATRPVAQSVEPPAVSG